MVAHPEEKRRDERYSCGSLVEWTYFNKPEKHSARMRNFSHSGACFECSQAPIHGATIMVRLEAYQNECRSGCRDKSDCPWPHWNVLGEVKWRRDITGSGHPLFGVGVRFHPPV